jgi:hypothetical protein
MAMALVVGGEVHAAGVDEVLINRQTGVRSMFGLADFGEIGRHRSPSAQLSGDTTPPRSRCRPAVDSLETWWCPTPHSKFTT